MDNTLEKNNKNQKPTAPPLKVGSVAQAIAVLHHLAAATSPRGVNAIARDLRISPSSCFNLLKTLVAEDFVDFDQSAKTYTLGIGPVALARRALDPESAFSMLRPDLERLADRHGIAVSLWRLTRRERFVLLGFVNNEMATRIHLTVGQRLPMLGGANGRCAAAYCGLQKTEIADRFAAVRWQQPMSLDLFMTETALTGSRGWALDDGVFLPGVTTVSAPVLDDAGKLKFCISATMFHGQHKAAKLEEIGGDLITAAKRAALVI